jgi:hypothetical protein
MAAKKKPTKKVSDRTPPKATGKAVSASGVRSMYKDNIKYYDAMLDSVGDILDYPKGDKLHKQAATLLGKYNYASKDRTRVAPGNNPYAGVSQGTANALSRDYNRLMKAVEADKKAKSAKKKKK